MRVWLQLLPVSKCSYDGVLNDFLNDRRIHLYKIQILQFIQNSDIPKLGAKKIGIKASKDA
jgi:hypothetical protein